MPKLDKYLRAEGTDFAHGYVSSPVCGPARAALFKGQYPHNTGVITNTTTHQEFKARGLDRDTVATRLKAAGYKCGHFGKYLNGYDLSDAGYVPPGWDCWFTSAEKREDYYEDQTRLSCPLPRPGSDLQPRRHTPARAGTRLICWPTMLRASSRITRTESGSPTSRPLPPTILTILPCRTTFTHSPGRFSSSHPWPAATAAS
jgi:hypothetical protein